MAVVLPARVGRARRSPARRCACGSRASTTPPALFAQASDPEVTRWFSWGPYALRGRGARVPRAPAGAARARRAARPRRRAPRGGADRHHRPLASSPRRDRRAMIGTWLGRAWWGTGANREAKALMCHLALRAARPRAARRVLERRARPLAARAGADRLSSARACCAAITATATARSTSSSSGCCAASGRPAPLRDGAGHRDRRGAAGVRRRPAAARRGSTFAPRGAARSAGATRYAAPGRPTRPTTPPAARASGRPSDRRQVGVERPQPEAVLDRRVAPPAAS